MDFESTLETITAALPTEEQVSAALDLIRTAKDVFPGEVNLDAMISGIAEVLPHQISFVPTMKFLLLLAAASLLLGCLGRVILGKRSGMNHAVSSSIGILFLYALTIILYTFKPWNLTEFLSPLPFMIFAGDYLMLIPFQGAPVSVLCHEILSMIILAFLVNLLDTIIPKGKGILGWYLLRFLSVALSFALHLVTKWAFDTYLPNVLVTYAPMLLLGILASLLLMGILNLILAAVLTVVNPIFGGIYTFFFSNIVGKQLTKAVGSAILVCVVFFLMHHFGYTLITISVSALLSYIPFGIVLLLLWYLIGHLL